MHSDIQTYNHALASPEKEICELLCQQLFQNLPECESKIWHAHPVWFLNGNPLAGYSKLKNCVRLLFWSGQSFHEARLSPEGSFKAAEARYTSVEQVNLADLKRWCDKAKKIQWDYKNIVKRRGILERIKT